MSVLRFSTIRLGALLFAVAVANSCMTEPACGCSPGPEPVTGSYSATRLRFTQTGFPTVDALSAGAAITITLLENGTTTGTFVIPASLNNGHAETLDLAGTFQNTSGTVTFSHAADTFIRNVPWGQASGALVTTASAGGIQYDVILTRN
jgi:hypothetical protein